MRRNKTILRSLLKKERKRAKQTRSNICKKFSNEKIKGKIVSIRRVTDIKYGRTVGELG